MKMITNSYLIKALCFLRVFTALVVFGTLDMSAKDNDKEIEHAIRVLKNLDNDQSKEWAVATLKELAEKDTVPYAMNAIGLAYIAGAGVEKDSTEALRWLQMAGEHGYSNAYHNIGMIYKYAKCGVKQNFTKAFDVYMNGASRGSVACKYDSGFMLYKGLGCKQNYNKAIELFESGAEQEHGPSLYMLGLCYRNGYGVEQDTVRASYYLNQSASRSFRAAIEELMRPYPENYLHEEFITNNNYGKIPKNMPYINPDFNDISLLNGTFQGFTVMYDWSGKYVLGEKPVSMTIIPESNNCIAGTIVLAEDSIPYKATIKENKIMSFTSSNVQLGERYSVDGKVNYKIDEALFDIMNNRITGRLSLYSLKEREPERPMYIELTSCDNKVNSGNTQFININATPNPFVSSFEASFELSQSKDAEVRIFDKMGAMVYRQNLGHLDAGKQTITITPNIKDGLYVLNVKAGNQVLRTIIVKKGGE